jgi:arylsulfatase A-like enzyme
MDWTATILASGGGKADVKFPLDGIDLMPVILGKKKEVERTFYWRISQRKDHQAIRDGKWKYLRDEKGNEYLFDINADPEEKNNLKDIETKTFEALKMKYRQWETTMLKPLPLMTQNNK